MKKWHISTQINNNDAGQNDVLSHRQKQTTKIRKKLRTKILILIKIFALNDTKESKNKIWNRISVEIDKKRKAAQQKSFFVSRKNEDYEMSVRLFVGN